MKLWQRLLLLWGGISLTGLILFVVYIIYSMTIGNKAHINEATKSDVRFVLNWCELGDNRIEKVIKSYSSPYSLTGDHLEAYSIKIDNVTLAELETKTSLLGQWYRCDNLPKLLDDAVTFAGDFNDEVLWFPELEQLKTKNFYVYPETIGCRSLSPYSVQLIFVDPVNKIVYYLDAKI